MQNFQILCRIFCGALIVGVFYSGPKSGSVLWGVKYQRIISKAQTPLISICCGFVVQQLYIHNKSMEFELERFGIAVSLHDLSCGLRLTTMELWILISSVTADLLHRPNS